MKRTRDAALVFYWVQLDRQIRVEGRVERVSAAESDEYFRSRPRESQLGALASPQSEVVESRAVLEQRFREFDELYRDREVERPAHWGGYRLKPQRIEFWQNRSGRLHDRILYERQEGESWSIKPAGAIALAVTSLPRRHRARFSCLLQLLSDPSSIVSPQNSRPRSRAPYKSQRTG